MESVSRSNKFSHLQWAMMFKNIIVVALFLSPAFKLLSINGNRYGRYATGPSMLSEGKGKVRLNYVRFENESFVLVGSYKWIDWTVSQNQSERFVYVSGWIGPSVFLNSAIHHEGNTDRHGNNKTKEESKIHRYRLCVGRVTNKTIILIHLHLEKGWKWKCYLSSSSMNREKRFIASKFF